MALRQVIGFSGAGLSEEARALAAGCADALYVSTQPDTHLTFLRNTVIEELAFGLEQRGVAPAEMQFRCEAVAKELGLDNLLEHNPTTLSGGQTRRLVIAAALVLNPPMLVLDNPFQGLDGESSQRLRVALSRRATTMDVHIYGYEAAFPHAAVEVRGEDPRNFQPARLAPVEPGEGSALFAEVTATRGVEKRWWRRGRVDFSVGPVPIDVPNSGILWLRGDNGSGKTTLLRELARNSCCAWLTQDPYDQVLESTVAAMYPDGAEKHPFDLPVAELRLAQLRQVRALQRPILLLDEPETGLDRHGIDACVSEIIDHLRSSGNGVVLVTHSEEFAFTLSGYATLSEQMVG